jgi:hypothetical protein
MKARYAIFSNLMPHGFALGVATLISLGLLAGCSKVLDWNSDPNSSFDEQVDALENPPAPPDDLMPADYDAAYANGFYSSRYQFQTESGSDSMYPAGGGSSSAYPDDQDPTIPTTTKRRHSLGWSTAGAAEVPFSDTRKKTSPSALGPDANIGKD